MTTRETLLKQMRCRALSKMYDSLNTLNWLNDEEEKERDVTVKKLFKTIDSLYVSAYEDLQRGG